MLCVGIVLTTLAYGTVHYWALAAFALGAAGIVCLWTLDALVLRSTSLSLNRLQWPILGMIVLGLMLCFVVAGIIEGFVTPSDLPTPMRVGIGVLVEASFLFWMVTCGRAALDRGLTGQFGEEPTDSRQ